MGGLLLAPAASADCTSYSGTAQCSDNSRGSTSRGGPSQSGGGHTYCDDPYDFDWNRNGECEEYGMDVDLGYDNRNPSPPQINNDLPGRIGGGRPGGGGGRGR